MKTKTILLIVALAATVPLAAAPQPNAPKVTFVIVDYVPPAPKLTKSTIFQYLKWLMLYGR